MNKQELLMDIATLLGTATMLRLCSASNTFKKLVNSHCVELIRINPHYETELTNPKHVSWWGIQGNDDMAITYVVHHQDINKRPSNWFNLVLSRLLQKNYAIVSFRQLKIAKMVIDKRCKLIEDDGICFSYYRHSMGCVCKPVTFIHKGTYLYEIGKNTADNYYLGFSVRPEHSHGNHYQLAVEQLHPTFMS